MRKPEQPNLGTHYTGAAVSRKTLFDEEGNPQAEAAADNDDDDDDDGDDSVHAMEEIRHSEDEDEASSAESGSRLSISADDSEELEEDDHMGMDGENTLTGPRAENPSDSDIDSDEAFAEGDEEYFKSKGFTFQGSKKDYAANGSVGDRDSNEDGASKEDGDSNEDGALVWDTEDEVELAPDGDLEVDDGDLQSGSGTDELSGGSSASDSVSDSVASLGPSKKPAAGRGKLRGVLSSDAATVASTLLASANADAAKGTAVKQQYQTFDRLLDARIKLQKGLITLKGLELPPKPDMDISTAADAAAAAALKLFSTIEAVRQSIADASAAPSSKKRKRPSPITPSTPASTLWSRLSKIEEQCLPNRRNILNKWSSKTALQTGYPSHVPSSTVGLKSEKASPACLTDRLHPKIKEQNRRRLLMILASISPFSAI